MVNLRFHEVPKKFVNWVAYGRVHYEPFQVVSQNKVLSGSLTQTYGESGFF